MADHLATRRKIAEAKKAAERAAKYAGLVETEWDEITAVEAVSPALEAEGPGGFRLRLTGLGGAHLVAALIAIATIVLAVAVARGWF